jgi:UDP-N-acetylglucosamine 2-epimerase
MLPSDFDIKVCTTGQHREMLEPFLRLFDLRPDHDLAILRPDQTLSGIVAGVLEGLDPLLVAERPDWLLVQGDTSTAMAAVLAAFHRNIPIAHVEAGLRTWDLNAPFPEEMNRQVMGRVSTLHLAPTVWSRDNLLREGVPEDRVVVTGNTGIDSLRLARESSTLSKDVSVRYPSIAGRKLMLVTGHRRENFGQGLADVCTAIRRLVEENQDLAVVFPVHLNPNVSEPVRRILSPAVATGRLILDEPVDYPTFVSLLCAAHLILTDSGGVQEEAPSVGKPCLITREKTERPEGLEAGVARLVGTNTERIVSAVEDLLNNPEANAAMSRVVNPYGDGHSAERVLAAIVQRSSSGFDLVGRSRGPSLL